MIERRIGAFEFGAAPAHLLKPHDVPLHAGAQEQGLEQLEALRSYLCQLFFRAGSKSGVQVFPMPKSVFFRIEIVIYLISGMIASGLNCSE